MMFYKQRIIKMCKKLFSKQYVLSIQIRKHYYNLFYQIDNSIKYCFNENTISDILDIFDTEDINKIYNSIKNIYVKSSNKFEYILEEVNIDVNTDLYITLINDISLFNMNKSLTLLLQKKYKLDVELYKNVNIQGAHKSFVLKKFIIKSQEQFWKDFHMCIEKTIYEKQFRLAITDAYETLDKDNISIRKDKDFYIQVYTYK